MWIVRIVWTKSELAVEEREKQKPPNSNMSKHDDEYLISRPLDFDTKALTRRNERKCSIRNRDSPSSKWVCLLSRCRLQRPQFDRQQIGLFANAKTTHLEYLLYPLLISLCEFRDLLIENARASQTLFARLTRCTNKTRNIINIKNMCL